MACCHSLTYVNGLLVGDPLDIEMFKSTKWMLDESRSLNGFVRPNDHNIGYELEVCRRFDFESKLQRMCSIVKNTSDNKYYSFVKGSPEKMATKCLNSSLPDDYFEQLQVYTEQGLRVIAFAYKQLNLSS